MAASRSKRRRGDKQPASLDELDTSEAVNYCRKGIDKTGFETRFISDYIGRGVFTTKEFFHSEFLLEYAGELLTYKEALKREAGYTCCEGSFMYFFRTRNKSYCVDATLDPFDLRKGRLVNDGIGKEANAKMVVVMVNKTPHLCLFALRDVAVGEEIRYDYGVPDLPWRKKTVRNQKKSTTGISDSRIEALQPAVPDDAPSGLVNEKEAGQLSVQDPGILDSTIEALQPAVPDDAPSGLVNEKEVGQLSVQDPGISDSTIEALQPAVPDDAPSGLVNEKEAGQLSVQHPGISDSTIEALQPAVPDDAPSGLVIEKEAGQLSVQDPGIVDSRNCVLQPLLPDDAPSGLVNEKEAGQLSVQDPGISDSTIEALQPAVPDDAPSGLVIEKEAGQLSVQDPGIVDSRNCALQPPLPDDAPSGLVNEKEAGQLSVQDPGIVDSRNCALQPPLPDDAPSGLVNEKEAGQLSVQDPGIVDSRNCALQPPLPDDAPSGLVNEKEAGQLSVHDPGISDSTIEALQPVVPDDAPSGLVNEKEAGQLSVQHPGISDSTIEALQPAVPDDAPSGLVNEKEVGQLSVQDPGISDSTIEALQPAVPDDAPSGLVNEKEAGQLSVQHPGISDSTIEALQPAVPDDAPSGLVIEKEAGQLSVQDPGIVDSRNCVLQPLLPDDAPSGLVNEKEAGQLSVQDPGISDSTIEALQPAVPDDAPSGLVNEKEAGQLSVQDPGIVDSRNCALQPPLPDDAPSGLVNEKEAGQLSVQDPGIVDSRNCALQPPLPDDAPSGLVNEKEAGQLSVQDPGIVDSRNCALQPPLPDDAPSGLVNEKEVGQLSVQHPGISDSTIEALQPVVPDDAPSGLVNEKEAGQLSVQHPGISDSTIEALQPAVPDDAPSGLVNEKEVGQLSVQDPGIVDSRNCVLQPLLPDDAPSGLVNEKEAGQLSVQDPGISESTIEALQPAVPDDAPSGLVNEKEAGQLSVQDPGISDSTIEALQPAVPDDAPSGLVNEKEAGQLSVQDPVDLPHGEEDVIELSSSSCYRRQKKEVYITKKGRVCKRKLEQVSEYDSDDYMLSGSEYEPSEDEMEVDDNYISDSNESTEHPLLADVNVPSCSNGENEISSSSSGNFKKTVIPTELSSKNATVSSSTRISVTVTNNKGSRSWDRKCYCPYCGKCLSKLLRHLSSIHKEELEVVAITCQTDKQKKSAMVTRLRNLGNHKHNCNVLRDGKGTLIAAYRPNVVVQPEDYIPCQFCLGYYARLTLWRHVGRCSAAPDNEQREGKHRSTVANGKLLLPPPKGTSAKLNSVLSTLRLDSISRIVKSDPLILSLGEKLFLKNGHDKDQHSIIRNTLREVGRLVKQLREQQDAPDAKLEDFIDPTRFQDVVHAARIESGFCDNSHVFSTPSLALKLGHSLKKCAKLIRARCLQTGEEYEQKKAERFLDLLEMNWTDEVSTHALRTLYQNKRNKIRLIPLTEDVVLFSKFLKEESAEAHKRLKANTSDLQSWSKLSETVLTQIMLFNRRRQGEASKMTLEDYCKKHKADGQKAVVESLSPLEQKLINCLCRVELVGKRGRTVPVLLTNEICSYLDTLVSARSSVQVHPNNEFVFARPTKGSLGHIRGCDCLRDLSVKSKAEKPTLIRSTGLRKQIATISQVLNLKDNELDILANFLGHDIRIHREYYRLPEETLQVAKVSKLLISLEKGQIQKGQSLDEIQVDLEEEIEEEPSNEDSDLEEENIADEEACTQVTACVQTKKPQKAPAKPKAMKKKVWNDAEIVAVMKYFSDHIRLGKIPGKREIEHCMANEKALASRKWTNVKDFVRNRAEKRKSVYNFTQKNI